MNKGKTLCEFPEMIRDLKTQAEFILIVEKETVFYKLLSESLFDQLG
jgi:DNA topoisomerase VI subunit A